MKTILFSLINSGFLLNRFRTLTQYITNEFKLLTHLSHLKKTFNPEHIVLFEQLNYESTELLSLYSNEFHHFLSYIEQVSIHHIGKSINSDHEAILKSLFSHMIGNYHKTKKMLESQSIDFLFIDPSEIYLIDLARTYGTKTIFLEHAPNFFPLATFNPSVNQIMPFKRKLPDIIISENSLTSQHWNHQKNNLKYTETNVIETGLPLDSMAMHYNKNDDSEKPFTLVIFNSWISNLKIGLISREFMFHNFLEELFDLLAQLVKSQNIRIILKNHPRIIETSYQTTDFYLSLAKKHQLPNFELSTDLTYCVNNADLALVIKSSSVLTDLFYQKTPSIIYDLFNTQPSSFSDDINSISPSISSIKDLKTCLKSYFFSDELAIHQSRLNELYHKFEISPLSVDQKCSNVIDFLSSTP